MIKQIEAFLFPCFDCLFNYIICYSCGAFWAILGIDMSIKNNAIEWWLIELASNHFIFFIRQLNSAMQANFRCMRCWRMERESH